MAAHDAEWTVWFRCIRNAIILCYMTNRKGSKGGSDERRPLAKGLLKGRRCLWISSWTRWHRAARSCVYSSIRSIPRTQLNWNTVSIPCFEYPGDSQTQQKKLGQTWTWKFGKSFVLPRWVRDLDRKTLLLVTPYILNYYIEILNSLIYKACVCVSECAMFSARLSIWKIKTIWRALVIYICKGTSG